MRYSTPLVIFFTTIALAACASKVTPDETNDSSASSVSSAAPTGALGVQIYRNAEEHYALAYPNTLTVEENKELTADQYSVTGTAFHFPAEQFAGTSLMEAFVHVGKLPGACPLQGALTEINGHPFIKTEWSGVGAGNLYQGDVFQSENAGKCMMVTLYTHSCNLGADCGPGHDQGPYDRTQLFPTLQAMVQSLSVIP